MEREPLTERLGSGPDEPTDAAGYDEAWTTELTRRLADIDSGRAKLLSVPEAMALIRGSSHRLR